MLFVKGGAVDDRPRVGVDLLGPLRLVVEGVEVDVRGPKRRAVLALLETLASGYRLVLGSDDLDLARVRELLGKGRAIADRDPAGARALLGEAHALWRGPVLGDLAEVAPVATAVVALEQLHRDVTDALIGCAIDAGQLDEGVVGLAAAALAADPLREPAALLLMRALAATGREPEALRTGREYRHRLTDEAGLDPSPALG
ncbi:MAG: AfsR/SARP family transcriptional regulator, partial [Pseudonocardiaceae bacterium]